MPNCLLTKTISGQESEQLMRRESSNHNTGQLVEMLQNQEETFLSIISSV